MNKHIRTAWIGTLALSVTGLFALPVAMRAADVPDSEQVNKLLSEAKTMAFQVKEDAATMETFTRNGVSRESQAIVVSEMKDHINALGRQAAKLEEAKNEASPWQKTAINRIDPFLTEMEGYTSAVIEHINDPKNHTMTDYKDYLEANADYSADLAAVIGDFVDYGKTRQRFERLGAKLEVAPAE